MIGNIPKQDQVLKFWNSARLSIQKELWRNKLNLELSSWRKVVAQAEIIEIAENVAESWDQKLTKPQGWGGITPEISPNHMMDWFELWPLGLVIKTLTNSTTSHSITSQMDSNRARVTIPEIVHLQEKENQRVALPQTITTTLIKLLTERLHNSQIQRRKKRESRVLRCGVVFWMWQGGPHELELPWQLFNKVVWARTSRKIHV